MGMDQDFPMSRTQGKVLVVGLVVMVVIGFAVRRFPPGSEAELHTTVHRARRGGTVLLHHGLVELAQRVQQLHRSSTLRVPQRDLRALGHELGFTYGRVGPW